MVLYFFCFWNSWRVCLASFIAMGKAVKWSIIVKNFAAFEDMREVKLEKNYQGYFTFVTSYIDHWHFPVTYHRFESRNFLLYLLLSRYNKDFLILTVLLYLRKKRLSIILYLQPFCWWLSFMSLAKSRLVLIHFLAFSTTVCSQLQFLEDE